MLENGIQATEVIPGRSELIDEDQDYPVMVDAANTPESLSRLLDSVRETRPGRVILVFGCEGERNKSLRPFMGEIAHYKVRPRLTCPLVPGSTPAVAWFFWRRFFCPQASYPSSAAFLCTQAPALPPPAARVACCAPVWTNWSGTI